MVITQKIKKSELHGDPRIIALYLHGNSSDAMPTQLSIQKTTNEPRPWALRLLADSVSGAGELLKGTWNANETNE